MLLAILLGLLHLSGSVVVALVLESADYDDPDQVARPIWAQVKIFLYALFWPALVLWLAGAAIFSWLIEGDE